MTLKLFITNLLSESPYRLTALLTTPHGYTLHLIHFASRTRSTYDLIIPPTLDPYYHSRTELSTMLTNLTLPYHLYRDKLFITGFLYNDDAKAYLNMFPSFPMTIRRRPLEN